MAVECKVAKILSGYFCSKPFKLEICSNPVAYINTTGHICVPTRMYCFQVSFTLPDDSDVHFFKTICINNDTR